MQIERDFGHLHCGFVCLKSIDTTFEELYISNSLNYISKYINRKKFLITNLFAYLISKWIP